jgi:alpha-tubulin suppressor-like RCC1 family protein
MIWEYNPDPYDSAVPFDTGIGITFNQKIKAGSGNITLSIANAGVAGTVVENFGIGNSVTITNNSLSLTPTSNLSVEGGQYCITLPSGVITNMAGDNYVGTAYTFETRKYSYQLWGVGTNYVGVLGQNQAEAQLAGYSSPVQVPGTNWEHLYNTNGRVDHSVVAKSDGTLWSWGYNSTGGLGHNDRTQRSSPTQVGSDTTWRAGAYNEHNTLATKSDGTLWMMGRNVAGVLGVNINYSQRNSGSSPVQVPGTEWSNDRDKNAMIGSSAAAIKTDGTLWLWGDSNDGVLAQNNTGRWPGRNNSTSSPVQIYGGGTTWKQVDAGYAGFAAVKTDGTLWIWGQSIRGQLGQNEAGSHPAYNNSRSSPTQIPGTTWNQVSGGEGGARWYATKTDGTLWAWGNNQYGMLAQNDTADRSSPCQIPGTTWSSAEALGYGGRGFKTDGTLWGWGRNNTGDLAQNNTTAYSSPVQFPGTDWYAAMGQMLQKRV